jgi:hypothetical protein
MVLKLLPLIVLVGMIVGLLPLSLDSVHGSPGARLSLSLIAVVALVVAVASRLLPPTLGFSKDGNGGAVGVSMIILAYLCVCVQGFMVREDNLNFVRWRPANDVCRQEAERHHGTSLICRKYGSTYRTFWTVFSCCAVVGACAFRRGRVTGSLDVDAELLHEAMRRDSGSDTDDGCNVVTSQAGLGRASGSASLSQREEHLQQRFWTEGGKHPYEEVVSRLRELRCYVDRSRSGAWVDPTEAFEKSMRASVWGGRWHLRPYVAIGFAAGVLVFFADNFEYINRPGVQFRARDVVFAMLSAVGAIASHIAGVLLVFRSTFEPVRFVRHANKAVSNILEHVIDEQRRLSDVMSLHSSPDASTISSAAAARSSVLRVSPSAPTSGDASATANTSVTVVVKHIDAAPFMSSLRSLPVDSLSAGVGAASDGTLSAGAVPSAVVDVGSGERGMAAGTGAAGGGEAVPVRADDGCGFAAQRAADERGSDCQCVAEVVVSMARRKRPIQQLDLADWYLLRENVQRRTRELMARSSVGLVVILIIAVVQIVLAVMGFVRNQACSFSWKSLYGDCSSTGGKVADAAVYWAWLAVAMFFAAGASMEQACDAQNMGVLCHLVDITNDSVVTDSRGHYSVAELKVVLATRAKSLCEYDRWPSLFDSMPVSPKLVYAARTWAIAPFVAISYKQLQAVFTQARSS